MSVATLLKDLRYEARLLLRRPGHAAAAVLMLALGIGANTAVFTLVNGVLLRPLPYPDSGRLVQITTHWDNFGPGSISQPEYLDLLDSVSVFTSLGLFRDLDVNLTEGTGEPQRVLAAQMTPSAIEALGVAPVVGRLFVEAEGVTGGVRVVLLGHALWRQRFGGDPSVVGRALEFGGETSRVVGVMPPDFAFPDETIQMWVAYQLDRASPTGRANHSNLIVARLKPDATLAEAQAALDGVATRLRAEYPDNYPKDGDFGFRATSYLDVVTGDVRPALLMLLGASGFVLLIAGANVANLLLARITERQRQIALRAALGASAGRLVGQLLAGSLLLSAAGGAAALLVAELSIRVLVAFGPGDIPRLAEVGLDGTVFTFNLLLVAATGLAIGLLPARRSASLDVGAALKEGVRPGGGSMRQTTRSALVVAEVALATVLLVGAGLLLRSVARLVAVDPGFRADGVTATHLALDAARYPDGPRRALFYGNLVERLRARPDVEAAGAVTLLPLSGVTSDQSVRPVDGNAGFDSTSFIQYRLATPGYFETMRIPVVAGRAFMNGDGEGTEPVAIASASLARRFWHDENPIGRRITTGGENVFTVVGVVGDVRHRGLSSGETPIWYRPYAQGPGWRQMAVVTRARNRAPGGAAVRDEVRAMDPLQAVYDVIPLERMIARSLRRNQFNALLLASLAGLALGLAALGIFAVVSYSVSLRTQEIGVRMALGAAPRRVLGMVLWQGLALAGTGVLCGATLALWLARALSGAIYVVTTTDAPTYLTASALLLLVAGVANLVPALRATRVDPMVALRHE
jgi:putative ABC transport system permease protein